jgi:PAS domain S-box-containing protein
METPSTEAKPAADSRSTMRIEILPERWNDAKQGKRSSNTGPRAVPVVPETRPFTKVDPLGGMPFQQLLHHIYDAVLITALSGEVMVANVRANSFFLCEAGQLQNYNILALIRGADDALLRTIIDTLDGNRFVLIQADCLRLDGTTFSAEISVNRITISEQVCLSFFIRDITLRKQQEEQLRTGSTAIQNAGSGIAVAGLDGEIGYCNPAFLACFDLLQKDGESRPNFRGLLCQPRLAGDIMLAIQRGETWVGDLELKRANGENFFGHTSVSPNLNENGELAGMVLSVLDVTIQKRAQQQLQAYAAELQRSNEELEQFAYVASHDLQEPLRMVVSYLALLERRSKDKLDAEGLQFLNFALEGGTRMQSLIRDLLAFCRVGAGTRAFQPLDLSDILRTALANLQIIIAETGASVTSDSLPTVPGDAGQFTQLLQNLITNAIKFRSNEPPRIHISARHEDGEWLFGVHDNGIGIAPEFFERVFVLFQRLHEREKYPGTGIGLAVCKKIVQCHGGRIWVVSEPQKGTTLHFTIPDGVSGPG